MRYLYVLLFAVTNITLLGQTNGSVKGSVRTSDGNAGEFVNINIDGTSKGAVADRNGKYEIRNVTPGTYTIIASFVGLESKQQTIEVTAGQVTQADFVLTENTQQLEEIVVSGRPHLNREESYVTKIPLKNLENPQIYNSVSSEILKQQAITNYDDAFRNIPGVFRTWESTGRAGDGASYFALRGLEGQPALVNGLPGITNGNLDPVNVEEVQVLKGPSATLFGSNATSYSSYGGIINTITKKPYFENGGELTYYVGSFGLNRFTADVNAQLSQKDKVALRVTTAYHTEGSFQDAGFKKSFFLAPSLAYEVNDRLKFLVVAEILEEERAVPPVFFNSNRGERGEALTFNTLEELNLNPKLSFTNNDLSIKNPRTNLQAQMAYKISDLWSSQTVISRGTTASDGYYTYIWPDFEGDNDFGQYFTYIKESRVTTDFQQNFTGDFKIGSIRNRVLVGLDYFIREATNNGLGYVQMRNVTPQGEENFDDPNSDDPDVLLPTSYLSRPSINNLLASTSPSNSNIRNSAFGVYLTEVMNITPAVTILAAVRVDYFDSEAETSIPDDGFSQWAVSPKFGVVYQPIPDKLSVFANYQNSFNNKEPITVYDVDGNNPTVKSFKPERANQWEVGVKANLMKDKILATVSYYNIDVEDRIIPVVGNQYDSRQGGHVESKGFEVELSAYPVNGLTVIAGFSHNNVANVLGSGTDFYSEVGRAPGGNGPGDQVNLWANYQIGAGVLKDFGFGIGGNYAGVYRVIDNSVTGTFDLPSYTLINASLFYHPEKFRFSVNVNNVTDEEYYTGYWSVNPQRPRNFVVSMAYKF
jgi:iron complex outermembrane recepter protein